MIYSLAFPTAALPLFRQWDAFSIRACLQGTMGQIYGTDPHAPESAEARLGDFSFFAGKPDAELLCHLPAGQQHVRILVPQNEAWEKSILQWAGSRAKPILRYATKHVTDGFDLPTLQRAAAQIPSGFELHRIDSALYALCKAQRWSEDLVSQYPDYATYSSLGIGVVLLKDSKICSGASSYCSCREGIEIQINTHSDCRRMGLAYCCAANLILQCLSRGLYPSWDAHNRASLCLAQKLGYRFSHAYRAIEVT